MSSTATAVISKFRTRYPSCSATNASLYLQDVLKELYSRLDIRQVDITVSLTASTREYDLNVDVTAIQRAIYKPSADESGWVILSANNIYKLDHTEPSWRLNLTEGSPVTYYIRGVSSSDTAKNVIGFIPIPDTTTSSGYPNVTLVCTQYAEITGSEALPSNLLNDNVLLYGMYYYYSIDRDDAASENRWYKLYEHEIAKNAIHLRNLSGDQDPTTIYSPVHTLTPSI